MTANLTIETFPNEAAADYIRGKAVADPTHFGNLPPQLKQRAFTVAGIEQLDALQRIRDAVAKLPEGASWDEAKKEIAAEISPFVGGDDKAAKAKAEFMLRTHGFQAYAVARHQQQMGTSRFFPTGSTRPWATAACGPATPRWTARCCAPTTRGGIPTTRPGTGVAGASWSRSTRTMWRNWDSK